MGSQNSDNLSEVISKIADIQKYIKFSIEDKHWELDVERIINDEAKKQWLEGETYAKFVDLHNNAGEELK